MNIISLNEWLYRNNTSLLHKIIESDNSDKEFKNIVNLITSPDKSNVELGFAIASGLFDDKTITALKYIEKLSDDGFDLVASLGEGGAVIVDVDVMPLQREYLLQYGKFPFNYGTVENFYTIDSDILNSLSGCPKIITKNFAIKNQYLTHLIDGPVDVTGNYSVTYCHLTSLVGAPAKVSGDFDVSNNELTELTYGPVQVTNNYTCSNNRLASLEGSPKSVGGNFDCSNNDLVNFVGAPESVGGNFICKGNSIKSMDGCPRKVGGDFIRDRSSMTEDQVRSICDVAGKVR